MKAKRIQIIQFDDAIPTQNSNFYVNRSIFGQSMAIEDSIVKMMLNRIATPQYIYYCERDNENKTVQQCGKCKSLDEEGHCDYQNPVLGCEI